MEDSPGSPNKLQSADVLIIGAGPAGSTAAALLAEQGLDVHIVERENFPRFKIGESLLPGGNDILRRLGVWEKMDGCGFIRKYGAEFVSADGASRVHNIFADGLLKNNDYTYQVERCRFDQLLLDNAVEQGAILHQPCRVTAVSEHEQGWQVSLDSAGDAQKFDTRWLLDASGRTAFLGKRLGLEQDHIPYPKRFAVYNQFNGVKRASGTKRGNIIITRLPDGWVWAIPLDDEKTSVGVVSTRKKDEWKETGFNPQAFFDKEIQRGSFLQDLMQNASANGEYRVTADYTYSFHRYAGQRHILLGDAASFIDPIFSSGVYLAMRSATLAADMVTSSHQRQRCLSKREVASYTHELKKNVRLMRDLIEVYYDPKGYAVFMSPTQRFQLFQSVNSIVAGNTNPQFSLRWRFRLFLLICRLNRTLKLVPDQAL